MKQRIIVIGGGLGGLSAGIRLQAAGHEVTLFEKRDKTGGKAYVYRTDGFTFDSGPTIITVPFLLDDLWATAGKRVEDYVQLVSCEPYYRIFNHQGRAFDYTSDHNALLEQIRQWSPDDVAGYERLLASTKPIFEKGFVELADKPFLKFGDMLRVAPDLMRLQAYLTVYQYVSRFVKDEFLRRCFSFHPLFIGGNPFNTTAIYAMVQYLEREWGVYYAMGGTNALVGAMQRLFCELGGTLQLNAEVAEILVKDRTVTGVRLTDGGVYPADSIVSNADVTHTYQQLIPARHRRIHTDRSLRGKRYSMSLVVIYIGTRRSYADTKLVHHNIIFGERYKEHLREIFGARALPEDFSLYVHMPSRTDPSVAPPGGEALYILSPVPNLAAGTDWSEVRQQYRDTILDFLEANYLPDLRQNIAVEHMVDPRYFQESMNNHLGAAFGMQPILRQSAWFRPHNRSEEFANLYFVGAGTHPGAGVPGVLSSAVIAAQLIGAA